MPRLLSAFWELSLIIAVNTISLFLCCLIKMTCSNRPTTIEILQHLTICFLYSIDSSSKMTAKDRSGQLTEGLVKWKSVKGMEMRDRLRAADTRLIPLYTNQLSIAWVQ